MKGKKMLNEKNIRKLAETYGHPAEGVVGNTKLRGKVFNNTFFFGEKGQVNISKMLYIDFK